MRQILNLIELFREVPRGVKHSAYVPFLSGRVDSFALFEAEQLLRVDPEDPFPAILAGQIDLDDPIEPSRPDQGRI